MLSTSDVAVLARCSPRTVRRAIADKDLAAQRPGRDWLIAEAEGKAWADRWRPGPFGPRQQDGVTSATRR